MAVFTAINPTNVNLSATDIANALLTPSTGLTIDPASFSLVAGASSFGFYDGSLSQLGIGSGLILTSGTMPGTTNTVGYFGVSNGMPGDASLDAVVNTVFQTQSFDATTLSFTVNVTDPTVTGISFNLVFGSDEYPEWVNQFVDIGAILVNGVNVAYFNHDPQAPLSVIGSNLAAGYFINNLDGHLPIEYDGVSAPMTVFAPVHQGINTIKIGVADTRDHIYDSALIVSHLTGTNIGASGVTLDLGGTGADDNIQGTEAAENIQALEGNDVVQAAGGDDIVVAGAGDDKVTGGAGNDYIDGGAGIDTAVYAGNAADYLVTGYTDGTITIAAKGLTGEGTDVLVNVEQAQFADGTLDLSTVPLTNTPPVLSPGAVVATASDMAPVVAADPVTLGVVEDGAVGTLSEAQLLAGATPGAPGDVLAVTGLPTTLPPGVTVSEVAAGYYQPPTLSLSIDPSNAAYQSLAEGETMTVEVDYSISNGNVSTPAKAVFTIVGTNDAPVVAGAATGAVTEDGSPVSIDLLANATDVDNGAVLSVVDAPAPVAAADPTATGTTSSGHGADDPASSTDTSTTDTASLLDHYTLGTLPAGVTFDAATGSLVVDPTAALFQSLGAGQVATLGVDYGVSDGIAVTAATAVVTVTGTNDAPVVTGAAHATVHEDTIGGFSDGALLANAVDPDAGDTLSVVLPDTLPDAVSLTVIPAHVIPAGYYQPTVFVPEQHLLAVDATSAAYQSLAEGETMDISFNYGVTDGTVTTDATAVITIVGANDAPVVAGNVTAAATEDGAAAVVDALADANDIDHGAVLTVVAAPPPAAAVDGSKDPLEVVAATPVAAQPFDPATLPAGVSFDAATNSFSLDPTNAAYQHLSAGQTQLVTVDYGVSDGMATVAAKAVFTVTGTNDAPVVGAPQSFVIGEDAAAIVVNPLANASDPDTADTLHVIDDAASRPAGIQMATIPGGYYQPDIVVATIDPSAPEYQALAAGETATFTWNYQVSDGIAATPSSIQVTVIGANDAPIVTSPAGGSVVEDGAALTVSALANAHDVDHGAVLSVVDVPAVLPEGITYDAATQSFSTDPTAAVFQALAQGETHSYAVSYGISDGLVTTQTQVVFNVTGVNDAPVISGPVTGSPNEDGQIVSVNATGNAVDVDAHQGLQVTGVPDQLPAGVSYDAATQRFSLDPGNAAYQHLAKGETTDVVVHYNVFDGFVEVPTSVIFTVTGRNDVPTVSGTVEAGSVAESAAPASIDLLATAHDVDTSDVLQVLVGKGAGVTAAVTSGNWSAPVAFTLDGSTLKLDPAQFNALGAGEKVDISFTYQITDGNQNSTVAASAHVTVTGENDAPTTVTLAGTHVAENSAAGTVVGILGTDDPDRNDATTYAIANDPSGFFAIDGNKLVVRAGAAIDYETLTSTTVDLVATDSGGISVAKTFTVAIDNVVGLVATGGSADDVFTATSALATTFEEDNVNGGNGNDLIDTGLGNDTLVGGAGNDTLLGGGGNDSLDGGTGNDVVNGGDGNDTIIVRGTEALGDSINGGAGTDAIVVQGTAALQLTSFNAGTSSIESWTGNGASISGTGNNDTIDLSYLKSMTGISFIDGGNGDDVITGSAFADDLRGGSGNDRLDGGAGDDVLTGGVGNDIVNGGDGNDRIVVSGSDAIGDTMNGGNGSDTLVVTGSGALQLAGFNATAQSIEIWEGNGKGVAGTSAAEKFDFSGLTAVTGSGIGPVDAGDGADVVVGSKFADDLRGGAGNDSITGGAGNDLLAGGAGNDVFVFNTGFGKDTITDFTATGTTHDTLDFGAPVFSGFAQVQAAMAQVGADVVITAGADSVTLKNVTVASLTANDFLFH